ALWLRVQVENHGPDPLALSPNAFALLDSQSARHGHSPDDTAALANGLQDGELAPGATTEGVLVFVLTPGSLPGQLVYEDEQTPTIALDLYQWLLSQEP
ncbi:MAG: DUF4352 domain-containing protein, partial [Chloroflexi bacterium]|nr:DUF4352 domain-containing protein [Chloroflexota bacterium]